MTMPTKPRGGRNALVNASGESSGSRREDIYGRCLSCLKRFSRKRRDQTFCSSRCRQMNWWLGELSKALHDGQAEGIRPRLEELGRRSS
jgi:endogenous inhibitor of DNA gyrase (YacG/DUF329 family)